MELSPVLDYGQSQTRAADLLGVALIHPVKAFEDPILFLLRDPDAGITDLQEGRSVCHARPHVHTAAGMVVLDGIITEIVQHFIEQRPHAPDGDVLPFQIPENL